MLRLLEQETAYKSTQHKPTKFALLGVGQAVPPENIAAFAKELFPDHTESIPEALTQAQEIINHIHERTPPFNLKTDLFNDQSPAFQRTDFVQPGTLELCAKAKAVAKLEQNGKPIAPDFYAGHSLGSIFAAYLAGVITERKDLREIGAFRGKVMQEAYEETKTTLVSIFGLTEEAVKEMLLPLPYAKIALINAPILIAVGLPEDKVEKLQNIAVKTGARKVRPLGTAGAFHVEMYMGNAAEQMEEFLRPYDFADITNGSFIANSDAKEIKIGKKLKEELVYSMITPVRYPDMLKTMKGVDGFIEYGPGTVLATLNSLNGIPKAYTLHIRDFFRKE